MAERKTSAARKVLRSRIERQIQREQEEQRRELLRRRVEIAKEGVKLYAGGKRLEAVKLYHKYLVILEMWKKSGRDGLTPEMFDRKKDIYELLLVSGIYWDIAKLYDKAKNEHQHTELNTCLLKFTMFSKGMPYQALSAEALRRYLGSGHCKHRSEFRKAYLALTGNKCFVATSLLDVTESETLIRLRELRDDRLLHHPVGRAFIAFYYRVGPAIVLFVDRLPLFVRRGMGRGLDLLARAFRVAG